MKVLITGGNGLLGSHVVRELLKKNYSVRVMVRKGSNLQAIEKLDLELFYGQITRKNDIENAVKGCEFVIHSAACTSQSHSDLKPFKKPNIESTKFLIDACKKFKVQRFLYVSTANCFGNGTKEKPGNEQTQFIPLLKKSGYAYSKFLAQQMVLEECKKNNFNAVVLNPTFIVGANDVKPSSGKIFGHVLHKRITFFPSGGKNFVDAESVANGVVNALTKGESGQCYLLAGENLTYLEFFKIIKKTSLQKTLLVPIPKGFLIALGYLGDLLSKILKTNMQLSSTNAKMLCLENYFVANKAVDELDFKIIPAKQSVEKAILWFNSNNYFN